MLHRRTVTKREIRIKFVCLALLSSILLLMNLNMKISREHAEALKILMNFLLIHGDKQLGAQKKIYIGLSKVNLFCFNSWYIWYTSAAGRK